MFCAGAGEAKTGAWRCLLASRCGPFRFHVHQYNKLTLSFITATASSARPSHSFPPSASPSRLPPLFHSTPMPGDILKKRRIAVLGSRSVGSYASTTTSLHPSLPIRSLRFSPHAIVTTGKSSLVVQFIENHFVESYYPTIESTFSKSINLKGVEYDCDIIDTAGQVRNRLRTRTPDVH